MQNQQIALDTYGSGEGPEVSTVLLRGKGWYETMIFWKGNALNFNIEWSYEYSEALNAHAAMKHVVECEIERLQSQYAGVTQLVE